ncbi:MAG: YidC/Oxa1 family membrane protein insertase [Patescibacteria group bacterium]
MTNLFNTYLYEPILSILVYIYNNLAFHDLGVSVILLTVLIRVVLFPLFYKGAKDQSLMQRLQPHIKKIQLDHKDNREEQAKQLLSLYKEHKLNPFSGVFLLLIQLPILIALYQVFFKGISGGVFDNHGFLGLIDLGEKSLILTIVAAALQYVQGKLSLPPKSSGEENAIARSGRMMVMIGPILTLVILTNFPAALGLYWSVTTLFSLGQQIIINKKINIKEHGKTTRENTNNTENDGAHNKPH